MIAQVAQGLRTVGLLPYRSGPLVFGLGLSKSGTTSLGAALTRLGYRHKSYDPVLLEHWHAGRIEEVFRGMTGYGSFEDWPYPLMHEELMRRHGRAARYVLTLRRSPEAWLESLKQHAMRAHPERARYREMAYGFAYPHLNEPAHLEFYCAHIASVRRAAERNGVADLLIEVSWENKHGWAELCPLLGLACPRDEFPHANRAKLDLLHLAANRRRIDELQQLALADTTLRMV